MPKTTRKSAEGHPGGLGSARQHPQASLANNEKRHEAIRQDEQAPDGVCRDGVSGRTALDHHGGDRAEDHRPAQREQGGHRTAAPSWSPTTMTMPAAAARAPMTARR